MVDGTIRLAKRKADRLFIFFVDGVLRGGQGAARLREFEHIGHFFILGGRQLKELLGAPHGFDAYFLQLLHHDTLEESILYKWYDYS